MINSRQKGKRIEREFAKLLRDLFPDIRRNAGVQSQSGGVDLENTGCFNFEVKGGKLPTKNEQMLDQANSEGSEENYSVVLARRDNCKPYVMMRFDDFKQLLDLMRAEGII